MAIPRSTDISEATGSMPVMGEAPPHVQANANLQRSEPLVPGSLSGFAAQMPQQPIQNWVNSPPQITDPGNQSMLPFDFGAGGLLTDATHSDPSHAPLWAKTAYSLRMAYGEDYVQGLLAQVRQEEMDEPQLIERIDQEVAEHQSTRPVARFWRPDGGFSHNLNSQQ